MNEARLENLRQQARQSSARADALRLLLFLAAPLCCLALTADYFSVARYFHGDEAVYYTMAESLAMDGDIRYERKDLLRSFERFNQGPQGIVLKGVHGPQGSERVYYAKPFLYSALIAPLVRWLAMNGAFLAGALLLLLCIAITASALRGSGFRWPELTAIVLFAGSASYLYALWIQPELMNQALVLLAYWLWLGPGRPQKGLWRSTAALALLGAVTFSKIPTGVLCAPILGTLLLRGRFGALLLGCLAFGGTAVGLFGLNLWATGEWNYQGGNRSIFYFARRFPYQLPGQDLFFRATRQPVAETAEDAPDPAGSSSSPPPAQAPNVARPVQTRQAARVPRPASEAQPVMVPQPANQAQPSIPALPPEASAASAPLPKPSDNNAGAKARGSGWSFKDAWAIYRFEPSMLWSNLGAFWVGRYSGQILYWPLLTLLLLPSLICRPRLEDVLIWATTTGAMVAFLVLAQDNYFGGSGTVGNRYFSMMLPPLIFTLRPRSPRWQFASLCAAALLCAQFVAYPFQTMFQSGDHAGRAPYRWFPIELSLVNSVSIPNRNFLKLPFDDGKVLAYLPDAGTYGWEEGKFFWTRGDGSADVVLRIPFEPLDEVLCQFEAGEADVALAISGATPSQKLRIPAGGRASVPLPLVEHYLHASFYGGRSWLYALHLESRGGFVPANSGAPDTRYLGVRVRFTADPVALARAHLERGNFVAAAAAASRSAQDSAEGAALLASARAALGDAAGAVLAGQRALALGAERESILPELAIAALEAGQALNARRHALELAALQPRDWWPHVLAARASALAGSEELAASDLKEALALAPEELEPRVLWEESRLARRVSAAERSEIARTPWPCPVELGGVLELEAVSARWEGTELRGRFLARAIRRPTRRLELFIHLLAGTDARIGLGRALLGELWNTLQTGRSTAHVELEMGPVPPQFWLAGEPMLLPFSIPGGAAAGTPHVWLGLGLLEVSTGDRLALRSGALRVIGDRALVSLQTSE